MMLGDRINLMYRHQFTTFLIKTSNVKSMEERDLM